MINENEIKAWLDCLNVVAIENEKKKCVINKHYAFEKAHKELGLLTDFELELYFKGYVQGMKDIVGSLGYEVVIDD